MQDETATPQAGDQVRDRLVGFVLDEASRRVIQQPGSPLGEALVASVTDLAHRTVASEMRALSDKDADRLAVALITRFKDERGPGGLAAPDWRVWAIGAAAVVVAFGLGFVVRASLPSGGAAEAPVEAAAPVDEVFIDAAPLTTGATPTVEASAQGSAPPTTNRPSTTPAQSTPALTRRQAPAEQRPAPRSPATAPAAQPEAPPPAAAATTTSNPTPDTPQ